MSKEVDDLVDELVEAIKETGLYKEYLAAQEKVVNSPDAIDKINEIRALNMQLQTIQNSDQAYDVQERLSRRYDELSEDQRVFDFIEAENKFIGKYQEIHKKVMENIMMV